MPSILWITHRDISSDLTQTSRLGIANELEKRGHSIIWMSPTESIGHFVFRSKRLGFGHRSFTRSIRKSITQIESPDIAIVEWTAIDNNGQGLVSGMYIYRYTTSEKAITRKMLYLK